MDQIKRALQFLTNIMRALTVAIGKWLYMARWRELSDFQPNFWFVYKNKSMFINWLSQELQNRRFKTIIIMVFVCHKSLRYFIICIYTYTWKFINNCTKFRKVVAGPTIATTRKN